MATGCPRPEHTAQSAPAPAPNLCTGTRERPRTARCRFAVCKIQNFIAFYFTLCRFFLGVALGMELGQMLEGTEQPQVGDISSDSPWHLGDKGVPGQQQFGGSQGTLWPCPVSPARQSRGHFPLFPSGGSRSRGSPGDTDAIPTGKVSFLSLPCDHSQPWPFHAHPNFRPELSAGLGIPLEAAPDGFSSQHPWKPLLQLPDSWR